MKPIPQCAVYYYINPFSQPFSPVCQKALALQMLHHAFPAFFGIPLQENLIKRDPYGKPYYDRHTESFFNITHCAAAVAVAVARVPIGIDIEAPRPVKYRTAEKSCSPEELRYITACSKNLVEKNQKLSEKEAKRFLALWTLKESYVKMTGEGMRIPFPTVCFDLCAFRQTGQNTLQWTKSGQYHSCLYTPGNITIALTLRSSRNSCVPEILWQPYIFGIESPEL